MKQSLITLATAGNSECSDLPDLDGFHYLENLMEINIRVVVAVVVVVICCSYSYTVVSSMGYAVLLPGNVGKLNLSQVKEKIFDITCLVWLRPVTLLALPLAVLPAD